MGHLGDDPEAYSTAAPTYNDVNGLLYFMRRPGKLQKYDLQGNYCGGVTIPTPPDSPSDFSFTDSVIIGRYGNIVGDNGRALLLFNEAGEQIDTVPSLLPVLPNRGVDDINSISVKKQGNAGIILTTFKSGDASASVAGIPFLWKSDNKIRYKENFNDTIYTVSGNELTPYIAFSTGKWHWGAEARTESKDNENACWWDVFLRRIILFSFSVSGDFIQMNRKRLTESTTGRQILPGCMPKRKV